MYHAKTDVSFSAIMQQLPNTTDERLLYHLMNDHNTTPFLGITLIDHRKNAIISKNWGIDMGTALTHEYKQMIAQCVPHSDGDVIEDVQFDFMVDALVKRHDPLQLQRLALQMLLYQGGIPLHQPHRVRSALVAYVKPKNKALPVAVHCTTSILHMS